MALNLIGQRFGRLLVTARVGSKRNQKTWACVCACGKTKIVVSDDLKQGNTKSCGCLKRELLKRRHSTAREGLRFGRLIILTRRENGPQQRTCFLCRCDCGKEKVISWASLQSGKTKSCGCLRVEVHQERERTVDERQKLSEAFKGEKSHFWKGGITPEHRRIRTSAEYEKWRTAVLIRDGRACQECGATGELHAHHLKSFAAFPELRFEISNGQTLCVPCHKKTPSYLTGKQKI